MKHHIMKEGKNLSGSIFGKQFTISTWGESHGKALGVVIDGCPSGISLCSLDTPLYMLLYTIIIGSVLSVI